MHSQPMTVVGTRRPFAVAVPSLPTREGSLAYLALQTAPLLAMAFLVVTRYWQDHPGIGWGLVAVTAAIWLPELRLRRLRLWWFAYVAGIFLYTLLRALADETATPTRTEYVIDIDAFLFFGHVPSEWLQARLFDPGAISLLDYVSVAIHWSFFIAPHAAAVAIFLWRRDLFGRYVALIAGTMWLGLLIFFLLPTNPPWLAGEMGRLDVVRIMDYVGAELSGGTYSSLSKSLGEPNSVAAMPSIHLGVTFAMYLWARGRYPRLAAAFLVYSVLMGAALVYLGEHYVADLLAGIGCAVIVFAVSKHAFRRLERTRSARTERPPSV